MDEAELDKNHIIRRVPEANVIATMEAMFKIGGLKAIQDPLKELVRRGWSQERIDGLVASLIQKYGNI
jgi:hypothetical protein